MDGFLGSKEPGFKDGSGAVEMGTTGFERGRAAGSNGEMGSSDSPPSSIAFILPRDDGAGGDDIVTISFSIDEVDRYRS
jgi:hypothetical protein